MVGWTDLRYGGLFQTHWVNDYDPESISHAIRIKSKQKCSLSENNFEMDRKFKNGIYNNQTSDWVSQIREDTWKHRCSQELSNVILTDVRSNAIATKEEWDSIPIHKILMCLLIVHEINIF